MKHNRLIPTGVLLVCVAAVVIPYRRDVWLAVAYERTEYSDLLYLKKRATWLPGKLAVVPDQVCGACGSRVHLDCGTFTVPIGRLNELRRGNVIVPTAEHANPSGTMILLERGLWALRPHGPYHCTCPDPIHEWNQ